VRNTVTLAEIKGLLNRQHREHAVKHVIHSHEHADCENHCDRDEYERSRRYKRLGFVFDSQRLFDSAISRCETIGSGSSAMLITSPLSMSYIDEIMGENYAHLMSL
jgi:hypothetical protein